MASVRPLRGSVQVQYTDASGKVIDMTGVVNVEFNGVPFIRAPGSQNYIDGWDFGNDLDNRFPGQDAYDFSSAINYNDNMIANAAIRHFRMVQQGERDNGDWVWEITLDGGTRWRCEAGCDFTGWDCQSWATWTRLPDLLPEIPCDPAEVRAGLLE